MAPASATNRILIILNTQCSARRRVIGILMTLQWGLKWASTTVYYRRARSIIFSGLYNDIKPLLSRERGEEHSPRDRVNEIKSTEIAMRMRLTCGPGEQRLIWSAITEKRVCPSHTSRRWQRPLCLKLGKPRPSDGERLSRSLFSV